jgi:hypothetical protein
MTIFLIVGIGFLGAALPLLGETGRQIGKQIGKQIEKQIGKKEEKKTPSISKGKSEDKKFWQHPIFLAGAAVAAFFILPKIFKK